MGGGGGGGGHFIPVGVLPKEFFRHKRGKNCRIEPTPVNMAAVQMLLLCVYGPRFGWVTAQ